MVIKSGAPALAGATGDVVAVGVAVLLLVFVSPVTGFVLALNTGFVPTIDAFGVTGTKKVLSLPAAIGPKLVHVTEGAVVEHVQPLLVKVAGAVTPVGNVIVVVMMPGAAPVPIFLTVMGKLLVTPTCKVGDG